MNGCCVPEGKYVEEYESEFLKKQRKYHMKLIRMMYFANHCKNTWDGRPWKKELNSCSTGNASKPSFSFDSISSEYLDKGKVEK